MQCDFAANPLDNDLSQTKSNENNNNIELQDNIQVS